MGVKSVTFVENQVDCTFSGFMDLLRRGDAPRAPAQGADSSANTVLSLTEEQEVSTLDWSRVVIQPASPGEEQKHPGVITMKNDFRDPRVRICYLNVVIQMLKEPLYTFFRHHAGSDDLGPELSMVKTYLETALSAGTVPAHLSVRFIEEAFPSLPITEHHEAHELLSKIFLSKGFETLESDCAKKLNRRLFGALRTRKLCDKCNCETSVEVAENRVVILPVPAAPPGVCLSVEELLLGAFSEDSGNLFLGGEMTAECDNCQKQRTGRRTEWQLALTEYIILRANRDAAQAKAYKSASSDPDHVKNIGQDAQAETTAIRTNVDMLSGSYRLHGVAYFMSSSSCTGHWTATVASPTNPSEYWYYDDSSAPTAVQDVANFRSNCAAIWVYKMVPARIPVFFQNGQWSAEMHKYCGSDTIFARSSQSKGAPPISRSNSKSHDPPAPASSPLAQPAASAVEGAPAASVGLSNSLRSEGARPKPTSDISSSSVAKLSGRKASKEALRKKSDKNEPKDSPQPAARCASIYVFS